MEIKQIYELTNDVVKEILGKEDLLQEDLGNIVDVGKEVFNAEEHKNFVTGLLDRIGKVLFVIRKYAGNTPSIMKSSWEYGSIMEKVHAELPEAVEEESWELEDGASYDPSIFHAPRVSAKFYNKRYCYTVELSVLDKQLKSAFGSPQELGSFITMLYNEVDKAITVRMDALAMRTINNAIATTYEDGNTTRAVNLLALYKVAHPEDTTITVATCMQNKEFLRFCALEMKLYASRMAKMSTLFNIGGTEKFTPRDYLKVVLHTEFKAGADVYLQSDTWHNEFTKLPSADEVPFWQGSGDSFAFEDTSSLKVKTASGDEVEISGVIGCMFDNEALGIVCEDRKVTSFYNPKAEFTNLWYKQFAGSFNDFNENFVMFYVAE